MILAIDPLNAVYLVVFTWVMYSSGWGKVLIAAMRANHWGLIHPSRITPMGAETVSMVDEEHKLK